MTYSAFIVEFTPLIQYFGEQHFPRVVLEVMHSKTKDLSREQYRELVRLLIEKSEFAPKTPKVVELASVVRNRHREGFEQIPTDDGPVTPEVAKQALATITDILTKREKR
jgi:hypothetical protein